MEQILESTRDAIHEHDVDLVLGIGGNVEEFGKQIGVSPETTENIPADVPFI